MGIPTEQALPVPSGACERRRKRRFAIEQQLKYKVLHADRLPEIGVGRSVNISSGGICFTTETVLALGTPIEISMPWPALLNDICPIKLVIYGSVIRSEANRTAVAIERQEFRTQGRKLWE